MFSDSVLVEISLPVFHVLLGRFVNDGVKPGIEDEAGLVETTLPVILGVKELKGPARDSLDLGTAPLGTQAHHVNVLQEEQRFQKRGLKPQIKIER